MGFYQKYELLEMVKDDGIKTFLANEKGTGQAVTVHLFTDGATPENRKLLGRIASLSESNRQLVLDWGDNDGTPYVVTKSASSLGIREILAPPVIGPRDQN